MARSARAKGQRWNWKDAVEEESFLTAFSFADVYAIPICWRCVEANGLCASCADRDPSILPQLARPGYIHLIARVRALLDARDAAPVAEIPPLNTPGRRGIRRLARALRGQHTRARRAS